MSEPTYDQGASEQLTQAWREGHDSGLAQIERLRVELAAVTEQLAAARERMAERSAKANEEIRLRALVEVERDSLRAQLAAVTTEAKAEALREAADELVTWGSRTNVKDWLRARAAAMGGKPE